MPQSQSPQNQRDLDSLAQIIKSMSGSSAEDITSVKKAFAFVERVHFHHKRLSAETLEIYAPIAYRLGIRKINRELEDLSFPYVYPRAYEETTKALKERHQDRADSLEKFSRSVIKTLAKEGLTTTKIEYRVKGLYSLYKKYIRHEKNMEKIYDVNAIRIMVDSVADCYRALGAVHG